MGSSSLQLRTDLAGVASGFSRDADESYLRPRKITIQDYTSWLRGVIIIDTMVTESGTSNEKDYGLDSSCLEARVSWDMMSIILLVYGNTTSPSYQKKKKNNKNG